MNVLQIDSCFISMSASTGVKVLTTQKSSCVSELLVLFLHPTNNALGCQNGPQNDCWHDDIWERKLLWSVYGERRGCETSGGPLVIPLSCKRAK